MLPYGALYGRGSSELNSNLKSVDSLSFSRKHCISLYKEGKALFFQSTFNLVILKPFILLHQSIIEALEIAMYYITLFTSEKIESENALRVYFLAYISMKSIPTHLIGLHSNYSCACSHTTSNQSDVY